MCVCVPLEGWLGGHPGNFHAPGGGGCWAGVPPVPDGFLPAAAAPLLLPFPGPPPSPGSAAHSRVYRMNNGPFLQFLWVWNSSNIFLWEFLNQNWAAADPVYDLRSSIWPSTQYMTFDPGRQACVTGLLDFIQFNEMWRVCLKSCSYVCCWIHCLHRVSYQ